MVQEHKVTTVMVKEHKVMTVVVQEHKVMTVVVQEHKEMTVVVQEHKEMTVVVQEHKVMTVMAMVCRRALLSPSRCLDVQLLQAVVVCLTSPRTLILHHADATHHSRL